MAFFSAETLQKFNYEEWQYHQQPIGHNSSFRGWQDNTSSFSPSDYISYNDDLMTKLSIFSGQKMQEMTSSAIILDNKADYSLSIDLSGPIGNDNTNTNTSENTPDYSEYQSSGDEPSTGMTNSEQESEANTEKRKRNRRANYFRQYSDFISKCFITEMGAKKNPMKVDEDFLAEECLGAQTKLKEGAMKKSRGKKSTEKEETMLDISEKSQGPPSLVEFLAGYSKIKEKH